MALLRRAGGLLMGLLATGLVCGTAFAGPMIHPSQGSTVRGKVQIEIARSHIPEGGYASIEINDLFLTATAGSDTKRSLIYIWDTKKELADGKFSTTGQIPVDGPYRIGVKVHDSAGKITETEQVGVVLQNRITPRGGGRMQLAYSYGVDTQTYYREKIDARVTELGMFASQYHSGEVEIANGESQWRLVVDDTNADGSAVVRMKVSPLSTMPGFAASSSDAVAGASYSVYARVFFLPFPGATSYGNLEKKGLFRPSRRTDTQKAYTATIPVTFPARALAAGDSWNSTFVNSAISHMAKPVTAYHTLLGYEWEAGHPCAKIRSSYNAKGVVNGVKGETKTEQISFFAYSLGKMLRAETTTEIRATGDPTILGAMLADYATLNRMASAATQAAATGGSPITSMFGSGIGQMLNPNAPPVYDTTASFNQVNPTTNSSAFTPTSTQTATIKIEVKTNSELITGH